MRYKLVHECLTTRDLCQLDFTQCKEKAGDCENCRTLLGRFTRGVKLINKPMSRKDVPSNHECLSIQELLFMPDMDFSFRLFQCQDCRLVHEAVRIDMLQERRLQTILQRAQWQASRIRNNE